MLINRGDQLSQIRCHVVYTLPISMVFTPKGVSLAQIFGKRPDVLPMIKVADRDGSNDPIGMDAMRQIVRKRLNSAGVQESAAFDSAETLD